MSNANNFSKKKSSEHTITLFFPLLSPLFLIIGPSLKLTLFAAISVIELDSPFDSSWGFYCRRQKNKHSHLLNGCLCNQNVGLPKNGKKILGPVMAPPHVFEWGPRQAWKMSQRRRERKESKLYLGNLHYALQIPLANRNSLKSLQINGWQSFNNAPTRV